MVNQDNGTRPVVVTAPTARNGITLLQRLLNSTRQIIVYGENKHLCEQVPNAVFTAAEIHNSARADIERARARFLTETTEFWSSTLWPDTGAYLQGAVEGFRRLVHVYQTCSEQYGFPRWGIKHPFSNLIQFDRFFSLLPGALFIYVYRNLFDVARSSKARQFAKTAEDLERLASNWREGVYAVRRVRHKNLLVVRHEDLVADPQQWLARLEDFTGLRTIDRTVMDRKFNTFQGPAQFGYSPTEYIAPVRLTEAEAALLEKHAGDVLAEEGYVNQPRDEHAAVPA
jgi:hypothetical protein